MHLETLRSRVDDVLGGFLGARLDEVATRGAAAKHHREVADEEFVTQIADLIARGG